MRAGLISAKAGRKLAAKTSRRFNSRQKDEGELDNHGIADEQTINDPMLQRGPWQMPSAGGGAGPQRQVGRRHIDMPENKKVWPKGAAVSASHGGPVGRKGGIAGSNASGPNKNWYSAGPGRSRG